MYTKKCPSVERNVWLKVHKKNSLWSFERKALDEQWIGKDKILSSMLVQLVGESNHIMVTYALATCTWWPSLVENTMTFANYMMEMLLGHKNM
jgi:hypothetical protein